MATQATDCPSCKQPFSSKQRQVPDRRPMTGCTKGHAICKACTDAIGKQHNETAIKCPTCSEHLVTKAVVNEQIFGLLKIIDKLKEDVEKKEVALSTVKDKYKEYKHDNKPRPKKQWVLMGKPSGFNPY